MQLVQPPQSPIEDKGFKKSRRYLMEEYHQIRNYMTVQYHKIRNYLTVLYSQITDTSKYYWAMTARLVWAPLYKNVVKRFLNGLTAVCQAMLYSPLLFHCTAGLS